MKQSPDNLQLTVTELSVTGCLLDNIQITQSMLSCFALSCIIMQAIPQNIDMAWLCCVLFSLYHTFEQIHAISLPIFFCVASLAVWSTQIMAYFPHFYRKYHIKILSFSLVSMGIDTNSQVSPLKQILRLMQTLIRHISNPGFESYAICCRH